MIALHCLAAAGCASGPTPYPTQWPERSPATGCGIAGAYQDLGELRALSVASQYPTHLSALLREGDLGVANDSSNATVHVWLDRTAPRMRVGSDSSIQPEPLRPTGNVLCGSDGALTLRFDSAPGSWYKHAEVTAWSATDGSLIVRLELRFKPKGVPFVPASVEVHWSRFERAEQ